MSETTIKKLARSFAQAWLRPDDPDTATPTLVDTLSTAMLAFYAAARPPSGGAASQPILPVRLDGCKARNTFGQACYGRDGHKDPCVFGGCVDVPPAPTEAPAPDLEALRDKAAARSAAEFANRLGQRTRHAEAVADCAGCNLTFLATWVLDLLGPEPEKSRAPGPSDPPKRRDNASIHDHAPVRDAALRRGGPEGVK